MTVKTDHNKVVIFVVSEYILEHGKNKGEILPDKNIFILFMVSIMLLDF